MSKILSATANAEESTHHSKRMEPPRDDPKEKTEILNNQFSSVFTVNEWSEILGQSVISYLPTINITPKGVEKLASVWLKHTQGE